VNEGAAIGEYVYCAVCREFLGFRWLDGPAITKTCQRGCKVSCRKPRAAGIIRDLKA
jgi:hypothetical protein